MMTKNKYPILEFDDNQDAKINPTMLADKEFASDKLIITFFPEVMDDLISEGKIVLEKRYQAKTQSQYIDF